MIEEIIFYILAILIIVSSIMVAKSKKLINSALFLAISLFGVACLYILLNSYFLAAIQILVYVGGVVVLIVFAIFTMGGGK